MSSISRRDAIRVAAAASSIVSSRALGDTAMLADVQPVVPDKVKARFESLPYEAQRLEGMFAERMHANVEGRLPHIWEREMLVGFTKRDEGGDPTGDWLGEHAGEFLEAACNNVRHTGNVELRRLADRVAKTLIASQAEDGYLGTYMPDRRWQSWDLEKNIPCEQVPVDMVASGNGSTQLCAAGRRAGVRAATARADRRAVDPCTGQLGR